MSAHIKTQDEIELKFLISDFDRDFLPNPRVLDIEQRYLKDGSDIEKRIRKATFIPSGDITYELICKGPRLGNMRRETTTDLSAAAFESLLEADQDPNKATIRKRRYVFEHADQTFEIDCFYGLDLILMEIELDSVDQVVTDFPPHVTIAGEVTNDNSYYNCQIAEDLMGGDTR